ncbi:ABC transporter ATP-binding protein [Peribacillus glennii]|uniref:ABC transporter ATP-binding protein n=1 Tax=Peribacillus glennii TaxID=2303991 RepID=A0A372LB74_9BACI|nr:ABC transporter ATP-binding protein [Peribacillus glennii]RFU63023.1 ABC transporter ATP-binding protein [Peribacillus glennii]
MRKLSFFLKPYKLPIFVALFLMLFELAVELIQPLLMAKIIDEGILQNDLRVVYLWGSVLVGVSILAFIGGIVNSFAASHVSQGFGFDVRKSLFEKVQSFSFTNLDKLSASSLITRLTGDVTVLQNTVFMGLRIMMRAPLLVIGGTVMALLVDAKLAFILLITIPVLIYFLFWVMGRAGKLFKDVQSRLDAVNGIMRENLNGIRLIKAFIRRDFEITKFRNAADRLKNKTAASLRLIETTLPILLLVMNISVIVILWFGSKQIITGDIKVGEVVAIVNYVTRITASFSVFSWLIMALSRAGASAGRINEVFSTHIDLLDMVNADPATEIKAGRVEFCNVSFQYPAAENHVLNHVSFVAEPGETVAILGGTGSGKTTLFHLIPRLYDADGGKVLIDGTDVRQFKIETLRKQIGVVPQEAHLFTGTVRENIAWGKGEATDDEIVIAATDAQIHGMVEKLPGQYETIVGQKGVNLSGGQKQRLSIARALVRKPKILLLDDSTSALDANTETNLLQALEKYLCTTFIITQKISTAKAADLILLLDDGQLIAKGSHEELLRSEGLYQRIYKSQFREEAL